MVFDRFLKDWHLAGVAEPRRSLNNKCEAGNSTFPASHLFHACSTHTWNKCEAGNVGKARGGEKEEEEGREGRGRRRGIGIGGPWRRQLTALTEHISALTDHLI